MCGITILAAHRSFAAAFALILIWAGIGLAQTTSFTYQGSLTDGGSPANGNYDLQFALFDGVGTQIGSTQTVSNVTVNAGIFTVQLDFGVSAFSGANRLLQISLRPAGGGSFTALSPRQQISSTPYAIRTLSAGTADGLSPACVACVQDSQINSVGGSKVNGTIPLASVPSGSANYIQNSQSQQPSSDFNISGSGTAGGTLAANIVNATTQYNIANFRMLSSPGDANVFVGPAAGQETTSGARNAFVGYLTGQGNTTGSFNSYFGSGAGRQQSNFNQSGQGNSFFGYFAGNENNNGNNNAALGREATPQADLTNATAIGAYSQVDVSNSIVLGSINGINGATANTNVGIGTTTPNVAFDVRRATGGHPVASVENPGGGIGIRGISGTTIGAISSAFGIGVYGFSQTGRGIYGDTSSGIAVNALAGSTGSIALRAEGSSWFRGDTTALSAAQTGLGEGIVIGSVGGYGYIAAWDYGVFQSRNLVLNRDGGNVGINTNAPTLPLDVNGRARIRSIPNLGGTTGTVCFNPLGDLLQCGASSLKLKTNVQPFRSGLEVIRRLQPINFNWKADGRPDIGLAAEEVAQVAPSFVFTDDKGEVTGVKYERLDMLLINAIKEQQAQIQQQRELIERQQGEAVRQQQQLKRQEEQINQEQAAFAAQRQELVALKKLVCRGHRRARVCR